MGIALSNKMVAEDPEPRVRFRRFGDSALEFELLCWGNRPEEKGLLTHELNRTIYKRFGEENIQNPFPQRDLHIYQEDRDKIPPAK